MFVSWKGSGWIALLIAAVCLLAANYLTGFYFHDTQYYMEHGWPKLAGFWLAAAIVQVLIPTREETIAGPGEAASKRSILRDGDSLFWVPIRYVPLLLFCLGVLFYFVRGQSAE